MHFVNIISREKKRKNQTIWNATPAGPVNSSLERTITGETGGNTPMKTEVQSDHHYHHHLQRK